MEKSTVWKEAVHQEYDKYDRAIIEVGLKDFFISLERINLLVERMNLRRTIFLRNEILKSLNS